MHDSAQQQLSLITAKCQLMQTVCAEITSTSWYTVYAVQLNFLHVLSAKCLLCWAMHTGSFVVILSKQWKKWWAKTVIMKCSSTYQYDRRANCRNWRGNGFICNSKRFSMQGMIMVQCKRMVHMWKIILYHSLQLHSWTIVQKGLFLLQNFQN